MGMIDRIVRVILPSRCVICDRIVKEDGCLCDKCKGKVSYIDDKRCAVCGRKIENGIVCHDCKATEHIFDRALAAFVYSGDLRDAVIRFKFQNRRDYAVFFAKEMAKLIPKFTGGKDEDYEITFVPAHRKREMERGYNQAKVLAEEISRITGIKLRRRLLKRSKNTSFLKATGRAGRYRNLEGVFFPGGESPKENVNVILVDDIYTTGSTADACAKVLKSLGAKKVFVLTICSGYNK